MSLIYEPEEDSYFLSEVTFQEISKIIKSNLDLKFLEMGCGSGVNLNTALKAGIKKQNILGIDINEDSVKYCRKLGFKCFYSDLFKNVKEKFDIIIFNPPYLPDDNPYNPEYKEKFDDLKIALVGGKNGSSVINKFLEQAKNHLNKNGKILILTSSLTKGIKWLDYKKKKIASKKLFFEELYVWELRI
ncbi:MAG: HemK2/MTQ2 family protein methyltransferase [Candidatus Pacearchaeota archaeon]|jgi:release factor glutamine methyltransferase